MTIRNVIHFPKKEPMPASKSVLKPCPFCGKTDIRLSIKAATVSDRKRAHHVAYYCWNCHAMGSRLLVKEISKYAIENDLSIITEAQRLWNKRTNA